MCSTKKFDQPIFICIEGVDGAGKNVQTTLLADYLNHMGHRVLMIDFPQYDSFFGREIGAYLSGRNILDAKQLDPKSMSLWYAMDRWNKLRAIDNTLYDYIIINRYTLSNAAYQSARVSVVSRSDFINWVFDLEHNQLSLPVPDMYIYLDVPTSITNILTERKGYRDYIGYQKDVYEKDLTLQENTRSIYLEIASRHKNVSIISCVEEDMLLSPDKIFAKVLNSLRNLV